MGLRVEQQAFARVCALVSAGIKYMRKDMSCPHRAGACVRRSVGSFWV